MVKWDMIVAPILLPLSFIMDWIDYWIILYRYYTSTGKVSHHQRVAEVQRQVKLWKTEGKGRKMCTARPSWKSITAQKLGYKATSYPIKVEMYDILEINKQDMTVTVEPLVTIGFLNRVLVRNGFTLPVVPEIDCLTISGLVMGGGLESTSHKYGMFHHICTQFEVVTADGECVLCDDENNRDLFHAIPISYGTFGFLTSITIKIIPFKPYIKLTYRPTYTLQDTVKVLDRETHKESGNDSVEGIIYSKDTAVIMTGIFVDEKQVDRSKVNSLGYWFKPWFYKHVQTFLDKGEQVEYVPTLHFFQRHNRPVFWITEIFMPWGNHPIARFLTGWMFPVNAQLLKLIKETINGKDYEDNFIVQDFMIPIHNIDKCIELSQKVTDVWPVWAVPARLYQPNVPVEMMPRSGDIIYVDIGVYGHSPLPNYEGRDPVLKKLEKFTLEHGGYQALYTETLMNFKDFITMYAYKHYVKVRNSLPYCNDAFPVVYEKVSREGRKGNWNILNLQYSSPGKLCEEFTGKE